MRELFRIYIANPIVALAVIVVFSIIALIGAAVLGLDRGVLSGMAKADYARGLITYLFAVITVGIAVAIVLYALTTQDGDENLHEKRFQRAKEVLALLLGLFGTIVGFYFGSETARRAPEGPPPVSISTLDISPQPVSTNSSVTIRATIQGGVTPYRYGVAVGKAPTEVEDVASVGGWIFKQISIKRPTSGESESVFVTVQDARGQKAQQAAPLQFQ